MNDYAHNQIIAPLPINKTKKIEQAQSLGRKGFYFYFNGPSRHAVKFVYLRTRVIYIKKSQNLSD